MAIGTPYPHERRLGLRSVFTLLLAACWLGGCSGNGPMNVDAGAFVACEPVADPDPVPQSVAAGVETRATVCPEGDRDAYEIAVSDDDAVLRVALASTTQRTPVDLAYAAFDVGTDGVCDRRFNCSAAALMMRMFA